MVTPQLNWRFIAPTHPASTASADVLATMKEQIILSSSYWRIVESSATGSNSLVLTQVSQDFKPMYIVIANNITGTTAYRVPDTNANAASALQIGLALGSGTFLNAQSETPFGSTYTRWWRYWTIGLLANLSQSFFIEGEDVLAIGMRSSTTNTQFISVAGAICETVDTTIAEDTMGRVCGIMSTGTSGLNGVAWASLGAFPGHLTNANQVHAGIFGVSGSTPVNDVIPIRRQTFTNISTGLLLISGSSASARVGLPLHMFSLTPATKDYVVGKLRNMYATANSTHLVTFSSGANNVAVVVGHSNTTPGNVMMFAPLSGTQLNYV